MQHSKDRRHHVVFLNVPQGHENSRGFKFSMTCHACSNPLVSVNHAVHVLQAVTFGIRASPKKRVKKAFPINRIAKKKTFPLRAVAIVLIGQFDVFVSRQFVTAPCHRFFPVSASLGVIRATHHLPHCKPDTSYGQGLQTLLLVLAEFLDF